MERVHFTAPVSSADLRQVLSGVTADGGQYEITFATAYGESRSVRWLTPADAVRRAQLLRGRGYRVTIAAMEV